MEPKQTLRIQDYLSLGYLFLLLVGILRESIYFSLLDVNIMSYSNIMDVLLSPVVYLERQPILFVFFFLVIYWIVNEPRFHQKHREKKWYGKIFNVSKRDERFAKSSQLPMILPIIALIIASTLLGTGLGAGLKTAEKMENQSYEMKHSITFMDGTENQVRIVGQNSSYIFYIRQGEDYVSVSPIGGVVKRIKR